MPLYEYHCGDCGPFSAWGVMDAPYAPSACPSCGDAAQRRISAPNLALMSSSTRQAHQRNERSAHEPRQTRRAGCGCHGAHTCSTAGAKTDHSTKLQRQTKPNARPWMLGH